MSTPLTPEQIYDKYKDRLPANITFDIIKNMPEHLVEDIALSTNVDFTEKTPVVIEKKIKKEADLESVIEDAIAHNAELNSDSGIYVPPVKAAIPPVKEEDNSNDIVLSEFIQDEIKDNNVEQEEKEIEIKFIDEPLRATNANNMEVELAYNNYIKKRVRSTYFVVLPVSGYTASVRGLTIEEIDSIKSSYEDYFTSKDRIKDLIFGCIQSSSIPITDLNKFKEITSITEFKLLLFGIIIKTFGAVNNLEYTCGSCKSKNISKVDINSILMVKDDELKGLIDTIMRSTDPQKEVDDSVLSKVKRFELPDTKIVVDIAIPSFKRDSEITTFFRMANKAIEESSIFNYMSLIKKMYIPHIQNDEITGYITVNSNESKYNHINHFTKKDRETINKVVSSYTKYDIDFVAEGLTCKKCGEKNKIEFNVIENFLVAVLTEM